MTAVTLTDPTITAEPNELADTAITPGVTPVLIPASRYTSAEFEDLERERLWPRVWQIACTVDHVVAPGDFYEYRCGALSVLIVRGDDGELRAFQNVCRHRGNAICQGSGSGLGELRCPYHRWAWDLTGRLREVPDRKSFGSAFRNEDFPLLPAQVDSWGPLVFVNLDLGAPPLATFLEGVPADSEWARLDEFRCVVVTRTPVESNWKVVADGFSETYHVQGIHSEMLGSIDEVHAPQRLWGYQGVSYQNYGVASPRLRDIDDPSIWKSFVVTQGARMGVVDESTPPPPVPPGQTMADVIAERIRSHQAGQGADLSAFSTEQILRLSQYNLFPNATVLVWGDMLNVLMGRPGTSPHDAEFVSFTCYRAAAGAPRTRPHDIVTGGDANLGLVMGQDMALLRTAQRGLRQPGFTHLAIGSEECRIINFHRNLERFLDISPSELVPIGG